MKKLNFYIFIFAFLLWAIVVLAQEEKREVIPQNKVNQQIPEGMEAVQIGGSAQLIVPKGAKTRKVGAQIIVEGTKEYMARQFSEMENRLTDLEKRLADAANEIEMLKKTLEKQKQEKMNKKSADEAP